MKKSLEDYTRVMRGTASPTWQRGALQLLRAYATDAGITILYQPCSAKSNEITALPNKRLKAAWSDTFRSELINNHVLHV